jgi:hypothetical protein
MKFFWENFTRYPRFFISSVSGLLIIIFNPIIQLFRRGKQTTILAILLLTFITTGVFKILQEMLNI